MASPIPSSKVKDKEYINWLKVTLALYYMKSGLHNFIQNEINHLHQSLVQKIYGGQTVPLPPCTMCNAGNLKRNKFTRAWAFQNQCSSYCDDWLHELLVRHTSPMSDKIYWNNSDIPSWPFKPWECAKVYMPRGQQPSNAGPSECDAQALLTLLASCRHFHQKLSRQGLDLTRKISKIRDTVIHSSEMKLSDADRIGFVQQITELLKDPVTLNSVPECKDAVGNINKIANNSLDVNFNMESEVMALRASLEEVRLELGTRKEILETFDSFKEKIVSLDDDNNTLRSRLDSIHQEFQIGNRQTVAALTELNTKLETMKTLSSNSPVNMKYVIGTLFTIIGIGLGIHITYTYYLRTNKWKSF